MLGLKGIARTGLVFWMGIALCGFGGSALAGVEELDPVAYRTQFVRTLAGENGENFCWQAAYIAGDFLDAYQAWGNVKWLEEAELYYDYLISQLSKDPDGYEGWIGRSYFVDGLHHDTVVGDAILCKSLLEFAEMVQADPALKTRFGAKAEEYVRVATRVCWDKFNARGQYYEDGGWGSYRTHDKCIDPATWQWVQVPDQVISDNLNKHYSIGTVILRLWRLTGKPEYRERVERIFGRGKAMWRHFEDEDRIVWNFWMPHGPYDMPGTAPKSWVGVHSSRPGYQAGEVGMFVEVYDSGLVFEKADLERMIRTNYWMAGGSISPGASYKSADGTSDAGMLWSALARFDRKIREAYEQSLQGRTDAKSRIARAYLKNVTEKQLGWDRLYARDPSRVHVLRPPLQPGRNVSMALVIPSTVELAAQSRVKLATQIRVPGRLRIELLDRSGSQTLGTLLDQDVAPATSSYLAPRWDGTNPRTGQKEVGEYLIRWSLAGESRVEPVWVKVGTQRVSIGPAPLEPGQRLAADFEGPLGGRWKIEGKGAGVTSELAHGGRRCLKLPPSSSAALILGDQDDLPVRITMWVYDAGQKFGTSGTTGGGWGVRSANGNHFCLRLCWRPYLNGDAIYAWFNTGENQWFNPHPAGIERRNGWNQWVLDFTNPDQPAIAREGQPLRGIEGAVARFVPNGVTHVYLVGGDAQTAALYVDDVTVEYPQQ